MTGSSDHGFPGGAAGAIILTVVAGGSVAGATQSDETGPILAFVGALLVVFITAVTTSRRLDRQLSDQSQHSRETLRAEGNRLQRRLDHERKLADIEHLRDLFDAAAAAFEAFHNALNRRVVSLQHQNSEPLRNAALKEINDGALGLGVELRRLELRFSPQHNVVSTYAAVQASLYKRTGPLLNINPEVVLTDAQVAEAEVDVQNSLVAFREFALAARAEIGVANAAGVAEEYSLGS